MKTEIKTLSLFSGAGGLDIGFHNAGFDIVGCVEIEKTYCDTLIENRNNGKYFNSDAIVECVDIRDFEPNKYCNQGIECVIGGPPCQPFSAAGRRSGGVPGIQDERGMLFESYCHVLSVIKPKVFVFENVYGLKGANGGEPWAEIVKSFSELGYTIKAEILDAADYGVPQHRERLIIVGYLDGNYEFPEPICGPDSSSGLPLVSIENAIMDLQKDNDEGEKIGGMYGDLLPLVPEGLNYSFFTKEMGYPEPLFAWRSKFHDFLYKADRSKPSRTLKAQPGKFTGPFHWNNRHFTIMELKRIQSFPDDYIITGTNTQIIAQIGNSVPPKLAEVIAMSIKEQLLRKKTPMTYPVRKDCFVSTFRQRQRENSAYYKMIAQKEIELRFGNKQPIATPEECVKSKYVIYFKDRFSYITKKRFVKNETCKSIFTVDVLNHNSRISIKIKNMMCSKDVAHAKIHISGLKKYLIKIDEVLVEAELENYDEIFEVWSIIQKELVDISQFFSLIDIYGHYANRGDTVKVNAVVMSKENSDLDRIISYFGNSDNCGIYITREEFAKEVDISKAQINAIIDMMRLMRFDVRTSATHPTIRTDEIICTYPFPMLSERVQFEKGKVSVLDLKEKMYE